MTNQREELLTSRQAARFLGVKLPTLYAYASRGLLHSVSVDEGRTRQYSRADLEALRARRSRRPGLPAAAAGALRFGEPVLDSSITALGDQGPAYRGQLAIDLAARDTSFEIVAELLWSGSLPVEPPHWNSPRRSPSRRSRTVASIDDLAAWLPEGAPPLASLALLLPALAVRDHGRFDRHSNAVFRRARVLVPQMGAALALGRKPGDVAHALDGGSMAGIVARAAGAGKDPDAERIVNRTLVLCADHELNVSAFAARVAASAGADLYACLSAALAALSGPLHGGFVERIEAVAAEIGRPERAAQVVHERYRRGEAVPGFFHPLYTSGDPRAVPLIEAAKAYAPRAPRVRAILALVETMRESGHGAPTIDVALAAVAAALGLPPGSAVGLFAVGRTAGWVAHVLEQYAAGFLIRPRARYVAQNRVQD